MNSYHENGRRYSLEYMSPKSYTEELKNLEKRWPEVKEENSAALQAIHNETFGVVYRYLMWNKADKFPSGEDGISRVALYLLPCIKSFDPARKSQDTEAEGYNDSRSYLEIYLKQGIKRRQNDAVRNSSSDLPLTNQIQGKVDFEELQWRCESAVTAEDRDQWACDTCRQICRYELSERNAREGRDSLTEALKRYDPEEQNLGQYIGNWIEQGIQEGLLTEDARNMEKTTVVSFTQADDTDEKTELQIPDPGMCDPADIVEQREHLNDLFNDAALVLQFTMSRHPDWWKHRKYQIARMSFTEQVTYLVKQNQRNFKDQTDIFRMVYEAYLDFFSDPATSKMFPLASRPLKTEAQLFDGGGNCPPQWNQVGFFSAKVPLAYLDSAGIRSSASDITTYRKRYLEDCFLNVDQKALKQRSMAAQP